MIRFINSHITAFRYIYSLIRYTVDNPLKMHFTDEFYKDPNGKNAPLRVFHPKKAKKLSVIIFPGASPFAEKHPAMINLASIITLLGYRVFIPRIEPLKSLNITDVNIEWFANAYQKIAQRDDIDSSAITITGISFGGSLLLNSILDSRMQNPLPKSLMVYGAAFDLNSGFEFLLTGKLKYNNETIKITPNEWGVSVIFHNFLSSVDVGFDTSGIRQVLEYRMKDDMDKVAESMEALNDHDKEFTRRVLDAKYSDEIKKIVYQIIFCVF